MTIHDVRTETRWFFTRSMSTWHVATVGDRALCRSNIRPYRDTYSDAQRESYWLPIPRCLTCMSKLEARQGRARKPASAVERDALAKWQRALPSSAMTALANAGYDQSARAEFLRNVVKLSADDVADFSADSYVSAPDDEYAAGERAGAVAGAADYDNDTTTAKPADGTDYADGYSDGYTGGFYSRSYWVHATDIVGYTFRADNRCAGCTIHAVYADPRFDGWRLADGVRMSVEANLDEIAAAFQINRADESSYDSDEFPKVIFASMVEGAETCGCCGEELA